jgi:very-short-patch-repair endonuclease
MRDGARTSLARQLRKCGTAAERRLWQELRNRKLDGCKSVRQATVGPYLADFLCRKGKLIVEVDGATHSSETDILSDNQRTAHLGRPGFKVIRLQNIEVLDTMGQALMVIREALSLMPSSAPRTAERPLPRAGEDAEGVHP